MGCCDFLAKDLRNHRAQLLWPLVARLGVRSVDIYFHTHPHCPVTDDRLVRALKPRRHEFSDTPRVLQLAMMDDDDAQTATSIVGEVGVSDGRSMQ